VPPEVFYQEGLAQRSVWNLEGALDRFDQALSVAPSAPLYASRAEVYRLQGHYTEAAADIERALAMDPELTEAWRQKALLSQTLEAWQDALLAVNKVIELNPRDVAAYVLRAQIRAIGFGELQQALDDYKRAIRQNSAFDRSTQVEQWHLLAELGKWREAFMVSHRMMTTGNEDPLRYFYYAWPLIELGQLDMAIQTLFEGIERFPDYSLPFYYALGVAYYERSAWSEAIKALEVALLRLGAASEENSPQHQLNITAVDILGRLGVAYLNLKQCETGTAIVERAIAESTDPSEWLWTRQFAQECYLAITPTPTPTEMAIP
jgi:tetratricopeptide (TPR) repeat protein